MKKTSAIVLFTLLVALSLLTGCAGPATRIPAAQIQSTQSDDKGIRADMAGGAPAVGAAEKPAEKVYVDKKGKLEISSTPFGYEREKMRRTRSSTSTLKGEHPSYRLHRKSSVAPRV
jgi:hypothetical protein